ncbi:MAG TPA: hypothetical protein VFQ44_17520 [Streptosporangiaceae bacterium]|nr:hypothetical protein [Streptosporangiaceae bacterium]
MLDDVIGYLRCPQCASGHSGNSALRRVGAALCCRAGHSFDIARSGYVNLLPGGLSAGSGDTAPMVAARQDFLSGGHYEGLASALADVAAPGCAPGGCVIELGAGTGYYLAAVLDRLPGVAGLALDLSKSALKVAARSHPRAGAVGCDAWRGLPVADGAAGLVLSVFAPRDGPEFRRVLRDTGRLIVVAPAADHLAELIELLGLLTVDPRKEDRLAAKLGPYFEVAAASEYRARLDLGHTAVSSLAAMGPGSWHADAETLAERVAHLPNPTEVNVAVTITSYRPRPTPPAPPTCPGQIRPTLS